MTKDATLNSSSTSYIKMGPRCYPRRLLVLVVTLLSCIAIIKLGRSTIMCEVFNKTENRELNSPFITSTWSFSPTSKFPAKPSNSVAQLPPKGRCPKAGVLTINAGGRLGNLMGEYATMWALAYRDNLEAVILPRMQHTLAKCFDALTLPSIDSLQPVGSDQEICDYQWHAMNLRDFTHLQKKKRIELASEGVYIDGYPTSVSLFHRFKDQILHEFKFRQQLVLKAQKRLVALRKVRQELAYVGVHVRRTDYAKFLQDRFSGKLVDQHYVNHAMARFRAKFQQVLFVVVSDDLDWCRSHVDIRFGDVEFAQPGFKAEDDLTLLAQCNHSIITYGNFGFWAAYLAGGEVLLASNVSATPTELMTSITAAKIPGWTFLSATP